MKKLLIAVFVVVVIAAIGVITSTVAASSVSVNRGACISNLAAQGNQGAIVNQAPGQSGNGPLTIVKGKIIVSAGFDGGVGCAR